MILLENLFLLIILTLVFTAASCFSLTVKKKLIPAIVSGTVELGAVVLLVFKGASIEELFLTVMIFGAITVLLSYFKKEPAEPGDVTAEDRAE